MPSEPDPSELSSALETLILNTDVSLLAPHFLGFATMIHTTAPQSPNQGIETNPTLPDRCIFFNPFLHQLIMIQSTPKNSQPPASKASIIAMPSVHVSEQTQCVICLDEIEVGGLAKEMPCNHKFHGDCIEKWLELHGSCPVCRYEMPVDEDEGKRVESEGTERMGEREIWVSFSFDNPMGNQDSLQTPSIDSDHSHVQ
ncbi:E3 ubiquitin-protein ligase MPSR1, partial [Cucurbita argyrosperma subsp. sororia]